jgi:hypothetical protein
MPSKTPKVLIKFGWCVLTNDVILGKGWSKINQCYLNMYLVTQEVLFHNVSTRQNTQLRDKDRIEQIRKSPRQYVVLLDRLWILQIGCAEFLLKPRKPQDPKAFAKERLLFINQPVPEEYKRTYKRTL